MSKYTHFPVLPIVLLIFIVGGFLAFFNKLGLANQTEKNQLTQNAELPPPSPQATSSATPSPSMSPSPSPSQKTVPTPVISPKTPLPTPIPTPSPSSQNNQMNINTFSYPNSSVISSSSIRLELTSNDSSDNITPWYKEKINALGFKAKSFVSTKTNGVVLNKLEGESDKAEVKIEISKPADSSLVKIQVQLNNK